MKKKLAPLSLKEQSRIRALDEEKEMKHQLMLWYSVSNGQDGSAYPIIVESQELAELIQMYEELEWGESCTGNLRFESDSPITFTQDMCGRGILTVEEKIDEVKEELEWFEKDGEDSDAEENYKEYLIELIKLL